MGRTPRLPFRSRMIRISVTTAVAVLLAGGVAVVVERSADEVAGRAAGAGTTAAGVTSTTAVAPTTTTTAALPDLGIDHQAAAGDRGPTILTIEERLDALGFWTGAPDETYDVSTAHAVAAFQKIAGREVTGVVDAETLAALWDASRPRPRHDGGYRIEIDLTRQVLLIAEGSEVRTVLDISSGKAPRVTPQGEFSVTRQIDGWRRSKWGLLYRPKYFFKGIAVHGAPSVPPYPASHGCVRVTNAAMDWIWSEQLLPKGTPVSVYA